MKEKILDVFNKSLAFFKKNLVLSISIAAAVVVIAVVLIIVLASGGDTDSSHESGWGYGITANIPEFDGDFDHIKKVGNESYVAYYSNVAGESVSAYMDEIEEKCNVSFGGDKYPCSAVYGDRIIVLHYNATEKKLSVTVVSKNIEKTDTFGANQ